MIANDIASYEISRDFFWTSVFKACCEHNWPKYDYLKELQIEFVNLHFQKWNVPRLSGGIEQFLADYRWNRRVNCTTNEV